MNNSDKSASVAYNWNFARDFPELGSDQVLRPHFLETIVDILSSTSIVFLEGEEGDGATTTLAQFCVKYPDQTFSLFIKPVSRFSYNCDYLRLALAEQFHWYVTGAVYEKESISEAEYTNLIYKVRKKKKNLTLYVVVDGIHQIPSDDFRRVEEIFRDVLPIGVDNFRFVVVGQQENFKKLDLKVACKPYQQLKFRPEDTEYYFSDGQLTKENIVEIHKICKAIPGRIASVKRLLNTGISLDEVLQSEPSKYLEFIKLEFNSIDKLSEAESLAVAIIAFSKRPLLNEDVMNMARLSGLGFDALIKKCTFLSSTTQNRYCIFISESHRKFAERKLEPLQTKTLALQVEYLLENPTSENALRFLPTYYQQLNKQQSIIDLISTDHYARLLDTTNSMNALRNRADLAISSANILKETTEIFKFSLQKSIFMAVGTQKVRESEVAALVAMNQTERALSLANQAKIKEDRLALLATYSKGIKEKGGILDNTLATSIKDMATDIDFTEHPDRAVEIASDILFFDPDLAIEIVDKANKRSTSSKEKDHAMLRMSVSALLGGSASGEAAGTKSGQLISDTALQKFAASLMAFTESMPIGEVVRIAEQMPVGQRVYFLRSVVDVRRKFPEILDLVDYALDVLIKETAYTPKSVDLADLSIPLPLTFVSIERIEHLIDRFDAQAGLITKSAFSKDLVLLQMRISRAQAKINREKACERITQAYYDVASVKTPEVQAECYSIMLTLLDDFEEIEKIEKDHGFKTVIKNDLEGLTNAILMHTADHFTAVEGILRSLTRNDYKAALSLAALLNIENRRDRAYATIVGVIGSLSFSSDRKSGLYYSIGKISDQLLKDKAVLNVYKAVERGPSKMEWVGEIMALRSMVASKEIACECAIIEVRIKSSISDLHISVDHLPPLIEKIDSKLSAINLNFLASAALPNQKEDAFNFFEAAQAVKGTLVPHSDAAFDTLERCIYLIIRISQPLMRAGVFDDEKYVRLCALIDSIPCSFTQIEMYSDMAARAWCANRIDINKKIIQERCMPIADSAKKNGDFMLHNSICRVLFPVIRNYHPGTAFEILDQLPSTLANDALYEAALLIIRKISPVEPYYAFEFDKFILESSDILDLYSILEKHKIDSGFYYTLAAIVDAISSKVNRITFTVQQKTDFSIKCKILIGENLPDRNNICHNGYVIASTGQLYRLLDTPYQNWLDLIKEASAIENSADRGYVYLELFKCIPRKYDADRKKVLADALIAFDAIPSPIDRLSHYENYANVASKDSASSAKETLKRAVILSAELEDTARVENHRRQLIDIADKIDPGLANELIELIDDDPARAHAKSVLKKSAELAKVSRTMANAKSTSDVEKISGGQLANASWTNFAKLVAGRLESKPLDVMTQHLSGVRNCSIVEASFTLTWFIENLSRRFTRLQDLEAHTIPLCEAIMLSTEMASKIIRQSYNNPDSSFGNQGERADTLIVNPGDRAIAIQYIKEWIGSNAEGYVKYCDPYFSAEDISFLKSVLAEVPTCKVFILTSISHLKDKDSRTIDAFQNEWKRISDQDPPETEIIALGTDVDEKSLFHDRWLLTKGAGLRIGTSYNSLGVSKISEISEMEGSLASMHESNLDRYFSKHRMIDGKKFTYWTFDL
jgi:hypothetical protein